MPSRVLLFAPLALVGCARPPSEPKVVTLPADLARSPAKRAPQPAASETAGGETAGVPKTSAPAVREAAASSPVAPTPVAPTPASAAFARPVPRPVVRAERSSPAVAVQTGSVAAPGMGKADETRPLGYRVEGSGALELEGVCRFSESEVACWDATGKDLPSLRAQIESALQQPNGGSDGLTVRFGRKNRIVVVRREQMMSRGGPMKSLSLQSIGTDPRQGGGYLNLQSETPNFDADKPMVSHEARVQAFDPDAKETQMRVMVNEPIPNPPEIALRKGASVRFAGCRFTVASVAKGAERNGSMFNSERGEAWTVRLVQTGAPSRPASFSVLNDRPLYRDAKGALVDPKTYQKWMEAAQRKGEFDFSKAPFQPVQVSGYGMGSPGTLTVILNADPKRVKTARLNGSFMRTVDLTGIPLDPR